MAVTGRFVNRFTPWSLSCTDTEARLVLSAAGERAGDETPPLELRGYLEGPYCDVARTLTAQFSLTVGMSAPGRYFATTNVTDPCYWSPSLPFLYRLDGEFAEGGLHAERVDLMVGLRRWEIRGASLGMNGERVVLRGVALPDSDVGELTGARDAGATLLIHDPTDAFCSEASRRGVAVAADLRGIDAAGDRLQRLAWYPAVLIALVDNDVWTRANPPGLLLARVYSAHSERPTHDDRGWARVCAVELGSGERLPSWAVAANFPVIAIRRGAIYADLGEARAACDWLQAELAPQFNLAGYFVAP